MKEGVEAGTVVMSGAVRSGREAVVQAVARAAVGVASGVRRPLEQAAERMAQAEERWSVCLRQVPAGSEVAQEAAKGAMAERVGSSALVPAVEKAGQVLVPEAEGFRRMPEESLDAMGPEAGRLSGDVLDCGPAARQERARPLELEI